MFGGELKARLFGTAVLTGTGSALGLASQALIARLVGSEGFGVYSFVLSTVGLAQVWLALDFGSAITRFVPGYWRTKKRDELQRMRRLGTRIVGSTASVGIPLSLLLPWFLPERNLEISLILIGGALAVALTLLQLDYLYLLAIGYSRVAVFLQQVLRPALVIPLASVGSLLALPTEYLGVSAALAAVLLVVALIRRQVTAAIRTVDSTEATPTSASHTNSQQQSDWIRYSSTFLVSSVAQGLISSQLDVILVGLMVASRESGVYAAATQLTLVAALLPNVMSSVLAPPVAAAHDAGSAAETRGALARFSMAQVASSLFGLLAVVIVGPIFLTAYGKDFGRSLPIALILSSSFAIAASFGSPASLVLSTMGAHRKLAVASVAMAILSVVLATTLVKLLGSIGAAWATFTVAVVRSCLLQVIARSHSPGVLSYRLSIGEAQRQLRFILRHSERR